MLARAPEAIDAFVVLAATSFVPVEAIALLREAVLIGSRATTVDPASGGEPSFDCDRRAHVRVLGNLARLLWSDARPSARAETLSHARRALRYDPDDRAGTRFLLMAWEADAGNWAAARRITRRYRDEYRTEVQYWLALHAYRDDDDQADALRNRAIAANPHVVSALHGRLVSLRLPTGS